MIVQARQAKRILFAAVLCAAYRVVAAHAGVEITQKVTMPDPKGGTKTATHTTIIQGNRLKTITADGTTITDLDKGTMVALDDKSKTATEMPIQSFGGSLSNAFLGEFKPTGKKKTVNGFTCEEYTHDFKAPGSDVTSVSCIAKDAPGAAEAAAFYRKMSEKMSGSKPNGSLPQGISVADEGTFKPAAIVVPGMPAETAKKIAEAQAKQTPRTSKSEVTSIKAVNLPAAEFEVPPGYTVRKVDPSTFMLPIPKPSAAPVK